MYDACVFHDLLATHLSFCFCVQYRTFFLNLLYSFLQSCYFIILIQLVFNWLQTDSVQATTDVGIKPLPQVIEATGSESPSTVSWNSQNHRARHDLSRARLRAIESSLENGRVWVPPSPSHRKTWEEEVNPVIFPRINIFAKMFWILFLYMYIYICI